MICMLFVKTCCICYPLEKLVEENPVGNDNDDDKDDDKSE